MSKELHWKATKEFGKTLFPFLVIVLVMVLVIGLPMYFNFSPAFTAIPFMITVFILLLVAIYIETYARVRDENKYDDVFAPPTSYREHDVKNDAVTPGEVTDKVTDK